MLTIIYYLVVEAYSFDNQSIYQVLFIKLTCLFALQRAHVSLGSASQLCRLQATISTHSRTEPDQAILEQVRLLFTHAPADRYSLRHKHHWASQWKGWHTRVKLLLALRVLKTDSQLVGIAWRRGALTHWRMRINHNMYNGKSGSHVACLSSVISQALDVVNVHACITNIAANNAVFYVQ